MEVDDADLDVVSERVEPAVGGIEFRSGIVDLRYRFEKDTAIAFGFSQPRRDEASVPTD